MNIIKILRKPYLAMFLASLMLFSSCSQYDNEINEESESLNLSNFVEKHLEISTEISKLMINEKRINLSILQQTSHIIKYEQINEMLESVNFEVSNKIALLIQQMHSNSVKFVKSNPQYKNLNKNEIESLITAEIDYLMNKAFLKRAGPCKDAFHIAQGRCTRNYAISAGTAAVVGIFTAGFGWLAGAGAALVVFTVCNVNAESDYDDCVN